MSWKKILGWGFIVLLSLVGLPVRADELETRTGELLTGRILSETADCVEFESTTFGKLLVERKDIVRLERDAPPQPGATGSGAAGLAAPPDQAPPASEPSQPGASGGTPPSQNGQAGQTLQNKMEGIFDHLGFLKKWKTSVGFGMWYRRGEDSDNNVEIKFRTERLNPLNREYLFEYRYYRKDNVSADGVKTVDDDTTLGEFRFRQKLRPRWFFQANERYYRDPMVNLFNEMTVTGGFGYKVVDRPTFKVSAIPALGAQYADYGAEEKGWHFVLGGYEDLQWDLTQFFKFRQSVYFFQDPFNRASHALRFHLELTQHVTKHFSFGLYFDYTFDGEVGAYIKQNQQRLGINLGMEF
jgi:putative salt-induced outer membrane protein YdiY